MTGMYIGLSYINAPKNDPIPLCNYRGSYTPSKYRYDWGKPIQILYHFSTHLSDNNGKEIESIIFEETHAVPTQVYIQITALEFSY
jgi:hypothetical protein